MCEQVELHRLNERLRRDRSLPTTAPLQSCVHDSRCCCAPLASLNLCSCVKTCARCGRDPRHLEERSCRSPLSRRRRSFSRASRSSRGPFPRPDVQALARTAEAPARDVRRTTRVQSCPNGRFIRECWLARPSTDAVACHRARDSLSPSATRSHCDERARAPARAPIHVQRRCALRAKARVARGSEAHASALLKRTTWCKVATRAGAHRRFGLVTSRRSTCAGYLPQTPEKTRIESAHRRHAQSCHSDLVQNPHTPTGSKMGMWTGSATDRAPPSQQGTVEHDLANLSARFRSFSNWTTKSHTTRKSYCLDERFVRCMAGRVHLTPTCMAFLRLLVTHRSFAETQVSPGGGYAEALSGHGSWLFAPV